MSAPRVVGGRTFELSVGVWVEVGVGDRLPTVRFDAEDPAVGSWPTELPDPADLARLGGPVRLLAGAEVIEIRFGN